MGSGKVPVIEKYGYGIGSIGKDMCYNFVGAFFMIYCTDTLGVPAAFMGSMFFFARLWDAVNDPMMGTIVDNTKTKWGKYRPWILIGTLINALVLAFMFYKPEFLGSNVRSICIYVAVMYVAFGMSYTLVDVPYWSFVSAITNDPAERDEVSTIPRVFAGLGNIIVQVLTLTMIAKLGGSAPNQGYFKWALIIAAAFVFFILITTFTIKERLVVKQDRKFSFVDALKTLKNNDQLMIIVVVLILINLAINMTTGVAVYYFKYVWKSPAMYSTFALIIGAALAVGLIGYPFLAKKVSRRKIFIVSMILPAVGFLIMLVVSFFIRSMEASKAILILGVPALIFCSGFGAITVLTTVMLVDTVDYGEWKLGYRSESIIFSMQTFMVKFATAFGGLITGWGLTAGGFVEVTTVQKLNETAEEAERALQFALSQQTNLPGVETALNIMMFIVPPVLLTLALVLYVTKYKLNGKYMNQILEDLKGIRAKKNAEYDALHGETAE